MRYLEQIESYAAHCKQAQYRPPFLIMLFVAIGLHAGGLYLWSLMPEKEQVAWQKKAVSISLGFVSEADLYDATQGDDGPVIDKDAPIPMAAGKRPSRPTRPKISSKKATTSAPTRPTSRDAPRTSKPNSGNYRRQFGKRAAGSRGAAGSAMQVQRYQQAISSWLDRHKIYPNEAFQQRMEGQVHLRIRIDRNGTLIFARIERSSGYPILDQAVLEAAKRANPLPRPPADFPGGNLLEFIIPIDFELML